MIRQIQQKEKPPQIFPRRSFALCYCLFLFPINLFPMIVLYPIWRYIAITALSQLKYKLVTKITKSFCTSKKSIQFYFSLCSNGKIFFVVFRKFCIEYITRQYPCTLADVFEAPVPPMSDCTEIVLFYIDTGQRLLLLSLFFSSFGYLAVFPLCGKTSSDMSLLLVYFQYILHIFV